MILRIDETRSVVWRTPTTLQVGLGPTAVVLEEVTQLEERLVSALLSGTTQQALAVVAMQSGGTPSQAVSLTRRLAPALETPTVGRPRRSRRLAVDGEGPTAERLTELASAAGFQIVDDPAVAEVAVIVGRYSIAPTRYAVWLGRDIPHLAVVHGDDSTVVGPFVQPGVGPCLFCRDRAATDDDPAWPAIASQLEGRRSSRESGATVDEIAAMAVRILAGYHPAGPHALSSAALEINASPLPVVHRYRVHPECGCRSPRGNGTARAASSIGSRTRPTMPGVDDVPA